MSGALKLRENLIAGIGHPLLDITVRVDKRFLIEHQLEENGAIVAEENNEKLHEDIKTYPVVYTAGGSILNTLRILQWLVKKPRVATFFGAVGNDEFGRMLYDQATLNGVNVKYQYEENHQTGTCIVLITGNNRSLCTNPASSRLFKTEFLKTPVNRNLLESAEYFYMSGFFLTVNPEVVLEVSRLAANGKHQFIFNIGAPFICRNYNDELFKLVPFIDVIFGNKQEFEALDRTFQFNSNTIEETVLSLTKFNKFVPLKPRIVIVTQGENPVIVGKENAISKYQVPELDSQQSVDTNGAGDAFVGGFLAQYIQKKDLETCVKFAILASNRIIQNVGCTFNGEASFGEV